MMVVLAELSALLREGKNSGVEFKRDDVAPLDFAKALVALSNLRGGCILLGVEDDGTISGVVRDTVDEWVLTIARDKVRPPLIPHVQSVTDPGTGRRVAVVTVEAGYAVYAVWHNNHFSYYIRRGSGPATTDRLFPAGARPAGAGSGGPTRLGAAAFSDRVPSAGRQ